MTVFRERCTRVRYPQNSCSRCVEVCPSHAIKLDPGPVFCGNCSECGLCQVACPTEAYLIEPDTDQLLLRQAQLMLGFDESLDRPRTLIIRCQEARAPRERSLAVPCLGAIGENLPVGAALLGVEELLLVKGACSTCPMSPGEELLERSIGHAETLMRSLEFKAFNVRLVERPKERTGRVGRRDMFSAIGNRLRASVWRATVDGESVGRGEGLPEWSFAGQTRGFIPRRRSLLRRLLVDACPGSPDLSRYRAALPWGKLSIDEDRCTACGICAAVCPTGAIVLRSTGDKRDFALNACACTNCGLCQQACREKAIDFANALAVADLLDACPEIIASVTLGSCNVCGDALPATAFMTCTTCDRRRLSYGLPYPSRDIDDAGRR